MKTWRKILIAASALAVVAIACFISWSYGFRDGIRAGGFTSSMAELMLANQHMADQITNASCEGVKQSIDGYLKVIEKYKDVKDRFFTETEYYGDKMLGNLRLSRIEGHMGNSSQAEQYMDIAKDACTHRKWNDCSVEKLLSFAKRLEEKNPIACLGNEK